MKKREMKQGRPESAKRERERVQKAVQNDEGTSKDWLGVAARTMSGYWKAERYTADELIVESEAVSD
jgi:hypothetical protein